MSSGPPTRETRDGPVGSTAAMPAPRTTIDPALDPGVRLMLAYQAGDEGAFDRLVETHSGSAYALLTRFMGPVAEREDLLQEAFLRVVRARDRYRPTARFSTWLYRILFNLCVNERERRGGRHERALSETGALSDAEKDGGRSLDPADEDAPEPWAELERRDVVAEVRRAIDALPDRQRMALVLAKYEELPYAEIAHVLDSSEKAIKSMIHRARENLRESLAAFLVEEEA